MDPNSEKLEELSDRIRKAEAKPTAEGEASPKHNVGYDFVGSVVGGGVIGALIDHVFGTSPWWLLGMVFLGFGAGCFSVWRAMQDKE